MMASPLRKFAPALVAGVALLAVGVANIDVHPTQTVTKTVHTPPQVVTKVRTRTRVVQPRPADGYITAADCKGLKKHTPMRDFIARYGWPAHPESSLGRLYYPLVEDHHTLCGVEQDQGQVYDVDTYDDLDDTL
jgi:hypothetical protein